MSTKRVNRKLNLCDFSTQQCFARVSRYKVQFYIRVFHETELKFGFIMLKQSLVLSIVGFVCLCFLDLQVAARGLRSFPSYTDWRLPRWILPREYRLRLLPYLEESNFTIDGQVDILLECKEETKLIVLHMAEIKIVKGGLQVSYIYKNNIFTF